MSLNAQTGPKFVRPEDLTLKVAQKGDKRGVCIGDLKGSSNLTPSLWGQSSFDQWQRIKRDGEAKVRRLKAEMMQGLQMAERKRQERGKQDGKQSRVGMVVEEEEEEEVVVVDISCKQREMPKECEDVEKQKGPVAIPHETPLKRKSPEALPESPESTVKKGTAPHPKRIKAKGGRKRTLRELFQNDDDAHDTMAAAQALSSLGSHPMSGPLMHPRSSPPADLSHPTLSSKPRAAEGRTRPCEAPPEPCRATPKAEISAAVAAVSARTHPASPTLPPVEFGAVSVDGASHVVVGGAPCDKQANKTIATQPPVCHRQNEQRQAATLQGRAISLHKLATTGVASRSNHVAMSKKKASKRGLGSTTPRRRGREGHRMDRHVEEEQEKSFAEREEWRRIKAPMQHGRYVHQCNGHKFFAVTRTCE